MSDLFAAYTPGLEAPASSVFVITPHDTNELAIATRAIRVTVGGVLVVTGADGVDCACNFADGETRPIRAKKVKSTGSSAGLLAGVIEGMA
jgi:hypothetical protein